MFRNSL